MALFAVALAADEKFGIVKSTDDHEADGSFKFSYEGEDGSVREEAGQVMNAGSEEAYVAITGFYKYFDPTGQLVEVHYTADENGFVPTGSHIPSVISEAAKSYVAKTK